MARRTRQPRPEPTGATYRYLSIADYMEATEPFKHLENSGRDWSGGSWTDAETLAKDGWADGVKEALPIVESALDIMREEEVSTTSFQAEWERMGSEVDIGRYVSGVPECMIEYQPFTTSKVGKVITLCASISYSASISTTAMIKRGSAIVALAMALEESQHSVEIWMDLSFGPNQIRDHRTGNIKVLLKGANDIVDPDTLAYWLAHPTSLRRWAFANLRVHGHTAHEYPTNPLEDLPDGTIYLGCVLSATPIPDPSVFVTETMKEIGLLEG